MPSAPDSPQPDRPLLRLLSQHLGLVLTGMTALIFLVKVLRASDWQAATAVAVATTAAVPSLLFGLAASLLPGAIAGLFALTVGFWLLRLRRREPITWSYLAILLIVGASAVYAVPSGFIIFIAALIAFDLWRKRGAVGVSADSTRSNPGLVAFTPFAIFLLVLIPDPWPLEQLTVPGAQDPIVGFVLEDEGSWVTVLEFPDRDVSLLRASTIRARSVCEEPSFMPRPLTQPILNVLRPRTIPLCLVT